MEILRLVIWFIAYTAGVIRLFAALMLLARKRNLEELKKVFFLVSFGGVIISLSNMELLNIMGISGASLAGTAGLFFSAALTVTLPVYIHEAVFAEKKTARDLIFIGTGAASMVLLFFTGDRYMFIILGVMSLCIIYSMIILFIKDKITSKHGSRHHNIMAVGVIILIVLMVVFDFIYPVAEGYVIIPILYLLVNIMMMIPELPELFGRVQPHDESRFYELMDSLGLTSREQDVAVRLIRGQTYQDIGEELFISLQTVKTHASRIYAKTGTGNKLELLDRLKKLNY